MSHDGKGTRTSRDVYEGFLSSIQSGRTWKMLLDKMSQEDASFPESSVSGMESGCLELSQGQDAGQ